MTFKGQALYSDIAVDFYGFYALSPNRTLIHIGSSIEDNRCGWDVKHASTHPQQHTWRLRQQHFGTHCLPQCGHGSVCLLVLEPKKVSGIWDASFLRLMVLYWLPIAISFGQITLVWLFGLMMAYRTRNTRPFWSGLFIGVGSFTKFYQVFICTFILRQMEGGNGFIFLDGGIRGNTYAFTRCIYSILEANKTNSIDAIIIDNGAFIMFHITG
jgi:hypothetical protein